MLRILKHAVAITLFVLFAGCSGSTGCSSGCSGCTPLPGGFNPDLRVENGASVRLTEDGVNFLEDNVGSLAETLLGDTASGGIIEFQIPPSNGDIILGATYAACPGGPDPNANPPTCTMEIDLGGADLDLNTAAPHNLRITGSIPIRLRDLPIQIDYGIFGVSDINATVTGNNACPTQDPMGQSFAPIPVDIDISVEIDDNMNHARYGYTRIRIADFSFSQPDLEARLEFCGGFSADLLNALKGVVFDLLVGPLVGTLTTTLEEQLCQQASPDVDPPCPTGSNDVEGVCRYGSSPDDECVSIALGTDGHAELGAALASISPGVKGGMNFMLAGGGQTPRPDGTGEAYGDLDPTLSGATLGMYGGIEPDPVSNCVQLSEMELPRGIPIPDELLENSVPGWPASTPGPHVGIAVSERFANYALNGMYNSGLLCLGVSTETVGDLLSSGTIGLLASSLKDLGLQREAQPIALVIRPGAPPTVTFGNGTNIESDPLLRVLMPRASFDFYIWSLDRYIRFMTATYDLDVPMNLEVTPEGLVPVLETIGVNNGSVENSQLLREDPAEIAAALGELVAGQVGSALGGGIPAVNLNDQLASLGLALDIPPSVEGEGSPGLRRLESGGDAFLGIFAAFSLAAAGPPQMSVETDVELVDGFVDEDGLFGDTMRRPGHGDSGNGPWVRMLVKSPQDDGTRRIEHTYRVDGGPWRPFSSERDRIIRDPWLRLQGRHLIEVRAREAGKPMSLDMTPAAVEFVVDVTPPELHVGEVDELGQVWVRADDAVSTFGRTEIRYRLDDGAWSDWQAVDGQHAIQVGEAVDIEVEARDEAENLAVSRQELIRGRGGASDGCGCSVPGGVDDSRSGLWLLGVAMLGVLSRLVRRRRGDSKRTTEAAPRAWLRGRPRREALAGVLLLGFAGSFTGCSCGDDEVASTYSCKDPCVPLEPGLIGAYTSVATNGTDLWVAGYSEANWNTSTSYGDLVVGRYDGTEVAWEIVDGVPDEPKPDGKIYDLKGFRGGQAEPGDDVGLWTSIALDDAGNPGVAYYDRTNQALRFAQRSGDDWSVSIVDDGDNTDAGRYAKLLYVGGQWAITYLVIEPADSGMLTSRIRIATGSGGNFSFEDAVVDENTPCRAKFCGGSSICAASTGACVAEASGCEECAAGQECLDLGAGPACEDVYGTGKLDAYPDAVGDYIAVSPDTAGGFGIAFYNRIRGNLEIARRDGGAWTRTVVDGEDPDGTDTGDVGMGASLHIDTAGDWHLAYTDGLDEAVRYARVTGGTSVAGFQVVDDGLQLSGVPFADGLHIVGDDSSIRTTASGEVHITYQDATSGTLRYATGTTDGASGWSVRAIEGEYFGGAFSHQVILDGALRLVHWWRIGGQRVEGDVAVVSP